MPTPNRGYIYPAPSSPATVPADLRAPLEQIDADVQTLTDQMSETVRLNPDGTLPEGVESQVEVIAREFGSPANMIPIFPTLAQAQSWELANPGRSALTVEPPPDPGAWQAAAPSFNVVAQTYTIPSDAGATYSVAGVVKAAGTHAVVAPATVTVVATARPGYSLVGVTEWVQEYVEIESPYDAEAAKALVYLRLDDRTPARVSDLRNRGTAEVVPWFNGNTAAHTANFGKESVGVGATAVVNGIALNHFTHTAGEPFTLAATFANITGTTGGSGASLGGVQLVAHAGSGNLWLIGSAGNYEFPHPPPSRVHLAVTWQDGTARAYVDGALASSATGTTIGNSGYFVPPNGGLQVRLGGVVYDRRAWTAAEIKALSDGVDRQ